MAEEAQEPNPLVGLKVVVTFLEAGVLIGISKPQVDVHVENCAIAPGDGLPAVLAIIPEVLERAQERWEGQPRFPTYQAPTQPRTRRTTTRGQQTPPPDEGVHRPRLF